MNINVPTECGRRTRRPAPLALCSILILCLSSLHAREEAEFTGWKEASTAHFRFIYADADRARAEAFAAVADTVWNSVASAYGRPPDKTDVIITGQTDTVNAYAEVLSYYMGFYTNPPLSPEFGYREDWPTLFFTHELTHIANFSLTTKSGAKKPLFGPFWNSLKMASLPGWAIEGVTTVFETDLTDGGRGRSPFFELLFKAPAMENAFVPFADIGTDKEPPRGQIYVMGYLLMRSVADRFGIDAIADIELKRSAGQSFPEAFQAVTGISPEECFRDVRIALAKKYAAERSIPGGRTVSPRATFANYYRPALIDGARILTLRDTKDEDRAAVALNPETGTETVLFEGAFADELSLAADKQGTIVAALQTIRQDRMPGYEVSTDLYTWTEETGLRQLTRGSSLFQPSLNRKGGKLVAVELSGIHYRLVEIHPVTGVKKILLESSNESYIQPSLSFDGSQIAFLTLDGNRASLSVAPMPKYDEAYPIPPTSVSRPVNASGPVLDIAYPAWSADGTLTFASNERGRLEVWEFKDGKKQPMLSDPVGAFWAERTDVGVYYTSYAGTGYVLKLKPSSEWGKVPSGNGPSEAGAIITLGKLAVDFPDFKPWPGTATTTDGEISPAGATSPVAKTSPAGDTSPVADTSPTTEPFPSPQPVLQDERRFRNTPRLLLWMPIPGYLRIPDDDAALGIGAFAVWAGYPLQNGIQGNSIMAGGIWYPSIAQAEAWGFASMPIGTGTLSLYALRELSHNPSVTEFIETTYGLLSFGLPFRSTNSYYDRYELSGALGLGGVAERRSDEVFAMTSDLEYGTGVHLSASLDLQNRLLEGVDRIRIRNTGVTLYASRFPSLDDKMWLSADGYIKSGAGTKKVLFELGVRARWFDLPASAPLPDTLVHPKGEKVDCLYPFRAITEIGLVFHNQLNTRLFAEKMISGGKNSAGMPTEVNGKAFNLTIDEWWYTGIEFEGDAGRNRIAFGLVNRFRGGNAPRPIEDTSLYMTIQFDALRQTF